MELALQRAVLKVDITRDTTPCEQLVPEDVFNRMDAYVRRISGVRIKAKDEGMRTLDPYGIDACYLGIHNTWVCNDVPVGKNAEAARDHSQRVSNVREVDAAAAARQGSLPSSPTAEETSAGVWSDSMDGAAESVATARLAREAAVVAPARRFAAALKRGKRKLALSERAKEAEKQFVKRMKRCR
jgi:hypothetical protein